MSEVHEGQESPTAPEKGAPPPGPPAPPEAPGWGREWPPPAGYGTHAGASGATSTEWGPAGTPPPVPPRGHRRLTAVVGVLLLVVAAAAGIGIGHLVWPPNVSAAAPSSVSAPGTSSGSGSGTPTSPYYGELPSGSGGPYYGQLPSGSGEPSSGSSSGNGAEGAGGPSDVASIAAKVDPALVDINSTFSYQSAEGAGTGIVLTSTGEILTNNHVIDGATKISVTDVGNGKTYVATVVGYDPIHDIAVLQLQGASGLQTAKLGNSANAATGESVVAVGNAGGTGGTPSSAGGSITALSQSITASDELDGTSEQLSGLIQINADVQPGDSGGSLVNSAGQVIGMDTAASDGTSFVSAGNQGYAIPIEQALATAEQIESGNGSSVVHVGPTAILGVLISADGDEGGSSGFLGGGPGSSSGSSTPGAAVSGVVDGEPAQKAGLAAGDVITSLGGQSVGSASALSKGIITDHPGDVVQLGWVDTSGQSHTANITLGSGPPA